MINQWETVAKFSKSNFEEPPHLIFESFSKMTCFKKVLINVTTIKNQKEIIPTTKF